MNQSFLLFRLQKFDTQLDKNKSRLEEIDRILSTDTAVLNAKNNLHDTLVGYQKIHSIMLNKESDLDAIKIKIETSEASLYSGRILNPKELRDLQSEVSSLKRRMIVLEDELLDVMVLNEDAENRHAQAGRNFEETDILNQNKGREFQIEIDNIKKTNERLNSEKNTVLNTISSDNLETYQKLRLSKKGFAVSSITDQTCSVCGEIIRPALMQAAKSAQQVVFCSSCGRILYSD